MYPMHHLLLGGLIVVQETASSEPTGGICGGRFDKQQDVGQTLFDVPYQVHRFVLADSFRILME